MVYTRSQPADVDVGISRPILAANTDQADTSFGIDHVAFSVATNAGYHKHIQFEDDAEPSTGPTGDKSNLYTTKNLIGNGSSPMPVFRNESGVGFLVPMACLCTFAVDGTIDANTVNLNVASVARASSAPNYVYTITFDKAMNNANYTVVAGFLPNSSITVTKATATVKFTAEATIAISGTIFIFGEISALS